MSTMVKVWITIMLSALFVLTCVTVWKITSDPRMRPVSQPAPVKKKSDELLDLKSYEMTERSGREFNFEDLRGHVWIANMFYSSCPHQCKDLNQTMAALQAYPEFEKVRFVSISVDPAVDTPEVLAEYAKNFNADEDWLFLSGDLADIQRFGGEIDVTAGYRTHVQRVVLFDGEGRPRGYYRFNDPAHIQELRKTVAELLAETGSAKEGNS